MAKPIWAYRKHCTHDGCKEFGYYRFDTRREMVESWYYARDWVCTRHTKTDELLTPDNLKVSKEVISIRGEGRISDPLFWKGNLTSGFISGEGFKAFAADFPEGTKLIITAQIELPPDKQEA